MTKRTVIINPGDLVEILVIQDPELPRTKTEFNWQLHGSRESVLIQHAGYRAFQYSDPFVKFKLSKEVAIEAMPPTSAADATYKPLISSDDDLLSAPSLHIQVYLAAKLRSWPSDAAFEAAGMAEKDFGKEPCLTVESLRNVLGEALRTDTEDEDAAGSKKESGDE